MMFEQVELDVSHLAPPEPMSRIIEALVVLSEQEFLKVHHRREPFPLFERLSDTGWGYSCQKNSANDFDIYIFKAQHQTEILTLLGLK